jgi:hypothetical protein
MRLGIRLASLRYAVFGEDVRVLVVDMLGAAFGWTIASFLRSADKI